MNSFTKNGFKGFPQKVHIDTGFRGIELVKVENPIFVPDSRMMSGLGEIYDVKSTDTIINMWRIPARRKSYIGSVLSEEAQLAKQTLDTTIDAFKIIYFDWLKSKAKLDVLRMKSHSFEQATNAQVSKIEAIAQGMVPSGVQATVSAGFNLRFGTGGDGNLPISERTKEEFQTQLLRWHGADIARAFSEAVWQVKDVYFPLTEKYRNSVEEIRKETSVLSILESNLSNQRWRVRDAISSYNKATGENLTLEQIEARIKEEYEASLRVPVVAAPQPVSAPAVVVPIQEVKPVVTEKPKSKAGLIAAAVGAGLLLMGGK